MQFQYIIYYYSTFITIIKLVDTVCCSFAPVDQYILYTVGTFIETSPIRTIMIPGPGAPTYIYTVTLLLPV